MIGAIHASLAAGAAVSAPVGFACTATGVEAIAPTSAAEACARMRAAVEQALNSPLTDTVASGGRAVRITLTFGEVIAKAEVTETRAGRERRLPTMYESSVDRPLGGGAVDALARAVGAAITREP